MATASGVMFCIVVGVAIVVGAYAVRDPNGMRFGAPWPATSELVAAAAAVLLGLGLRAQRREANRALFAAGLGGAAVALTMLGVIALLLSFNQA